MVATPAPPSSIARAAAHGAAWTIAASIAARLIGLGGTLIATRFLAPAVMGEVTAAMIISLTTGWLFTWGFGQYAVVKGRGADEREVTWHATVAYTVVGVVGFGLLVALAPLIAGALDAPAAARYLPGFAIAAVIRRCGAIPERVLSRSLRFRSVAVANAGGEVTYALVATSLAASGWGGDAVIAGNIAQSLIATAALIAAAGVRSWATPVRLRWSRFADMARFGIPLAIQSIAHSASRYWGTLVIAHAFGAAATGVYSLAYNLADIPAIYIGEQLALVLMPSMANLPPERRARAFERAAGLLAIVLFPLAIGLGLVGKPLIALLLPPSWQGVAPLLAVLSALSVTRPILAALSAYLEADARTGQLMLLELANLVVLLGLMYLASPLGLVWSACAVGIAYGSSAVVGVNIVARRGLSRRRLVDGFVRPLVACGAMAFAVLALRTVIAGHVPLALQLALEIAVGAIVYIGAALTVCGDAARDLLSLATDVVRRRRA